MRTILTKDSQAYRVLALVALSGECAEEALTLLLPQESYRQKVLRRLLEERLLSKYQKDGVKGYRLMQKGERNPTTVRVGTVFFLSGRRCRFFHAQGRLNTKTTAALHFGNTGDYGTCRDSDGSQ